MPWIRVAPIAPSSPLNIPNASHKVTIQEGV